MEYSVADAPFDPLQVRRLRDDSQRAAHRARAVQRALRPAQQLDALDVDHLDVGVTGLVAVDLRPESGDRRFAEVAADRRVRVELRTERNAADRDRVRARAAILVADGRQRREVILHADQVSLLDLIRRNDADGRGRFLQVRFALRCCDNDFFETALVHLFCGVCGEGRCGCGYCGGRGESTEYAESTDSVRTRIARSPMVFSRSSGFLSQVCPADSCPTPRACAN